MSNNTPIKRISCNAMVASIFKETRQGRDGEFTAYNIQLQRSYTTKDGERRYTPNMDHGDLSAATFALQEAWRAIGDMKAADNAQES